MAQEYCLHYASGADDVSAERQYGGVFLMLKITAWFFVIVFTVAALIGFYAVFADVPALRFGSPPPNASFANRAQIDSVLIPAGMLLLALLFAAGNILGFSSGIGRGSLLTAACLLILLQISTFLMQVVAIGPPEYTRRHGSEFLITTAAYMASISVLSWTFPLLCIIAVVSWIRDQSANGELTSRWLPLARTIAIVSTVYGVLNLIKSVGNLLIMSAHPTSFAGMTHSISGLTTLGLPLLAYGLYAGAGILILLNQGAGRILLFPAMAWSAFWVLSALIKLPNRQFVRAFDRQLQISWCSSFILFAILACIILLQRGLFARNRQT